MENNRLPTNRRDAENVLRRRGVNESKIYSILNKYNQARYWHEAPCAVTDYHSKYSLEKHFEGLGKGTLYGFELEIEYKGQGYANEVAYLVHELAESTIGKGLIRMERDGSLTNGIEIISAPLSEIELRLKYSKIYKFLRGLKKLGFVSHNPGSCGLHIHITKPEAKIVGKIENLILKNPDIRSFWNELSRRGERTSYTKFEKQRHNSSNKYFALNKMNAKTIEMRLFRGTLKPSSFFASLESTFALVNFTANNKGGSWRQFVDYVQKNKVKKYPYFLNFVAKSMANNWRVPKPKPRVRLSPEQRAIRDAEALQRKIYKQSVRQTRMAQEINGWLDSTLRSTRNCNETALPDLTYEIRACQVMIARGSLAEDRKLGALVTPICFKSIPREMYKDRGYRPTIGISKTRGWGRSSSYAYLHKTQAHYMFSITGKQIGYLEREDRTIPNTGLSSWIPEYSYR